MVVNKVAINVEIATTLILLQMHRKHFVKRMFGEMGNKSYVNTDGQTVEMTFLGASRSDRDP